MTFAPDVAHAMIDRMSRNVNDTIRTLNSGRREKVETRAAELIAEEMTLREPRRTRKITQVSVARALKPRAAAR